MITAFAAIAALSSPFLSLCETRERHQEARATKERRRQPTNKKGSRRQEERTKKRRKRTWEELSLQVLRFSQLPSVPRAPCLPASSPFMLGAFAALAALPPGVVNLHDCGLRCPCSLVSQPSLSFCDRCLRCSWRLVSQPRLPSAFGALFVCLLLSFPFVRHGGDIRKQGPPRKEEGKRRTKKENKGKKKEQRQEERTKKRRKRTWEESSLQNLRFTQNG